MSSVLWGEIKEEQIFPTSNRIPEIIKTDVPEKKVILATKTQKVKIKNSYCQRVSQKRPKAHDSSLDKRRIIELSDSNIKTDVTNATTFMLQYYQFDEVESSVTDVLNQLWRDYLEQFGKRAQEKKEIAARSKRQINMDSVLNRVLKETGMTNSSEGIFDLINWYQDEYSASQIYKFNSSSEQPIQTHSDFSTTNDENPELRTMSDDSKHESAAKRPKVEMNGASEDIDDSIINEMVSNPLVGDLDTFVSNQNISSVTGHRKRQIDVLLPPIDDDSEDLFSSNKI